jgi:Putative phage abortive infection protein
LSRQQLFESSFFQLLSAHGRIVDGISTPYNGKELRSRDCFTQWYAQFRKKLFPAALQESGGDTVAAVQPAFDRLYAIWRTDLGHYFRSLYNLIKFVKEANRADGRRYTNLVRAQMSDQELLVLFYNCLTLRGAKFKPLIVEFALLKHLDPNDLCHPDHHGLYENAAYGLPKA